MKPYPLYKVDPINNLKELIDYCAEKHGDQTAFSWLYKDKTNNKSFNQFQSDIYTLGAYFINAGYRNDKIAIIGENSYEWIITFFAVANSGNIVVPIDKELDADETAALLSHSDAKVLVYADSAVDKIKDYDKKTLIELIIHMKTDLPDIIGKVDKSARTRFSEVAIENNQLCAIIYTSGTTGAPKGVMITHKNLIGNALNASKYLLVEGTALLFLPLSHNFSIMASLLSQLYKGNKIIINSNLKNVADELIKFGPHIIPAVPLFIENMHNRIWDAAKKKRKDKQLMFLISISNLLLRLGVDLRKRMFSTILSSLGGNLNIIVSGGAPIDVKLVKEFRSFGIMIFNGYGITECSPVISINRNNYYRDGSVGIPIPGCEVKIVDGEIWVRGDGIMLGYYKDPQATEDAFCDGWFKTGDLGYLDNDGFLYVTGRKKNLILLSNGYNVCPEELEERLKKIPGVVEVMVYQGDNKIIAEIYPDSTIAGVQEIIKQSINDLNVTLPKHKRIGEIKFRETEFEKTSTKKIKRNQANCAE